MASNFEIKLCPVQKDDLSIFFQHQLDPEANHMAAFTAKNPNDRTAFDEKWKKILADESITLRTILCDEKVAGHIVCHKWFGDPEISYWIDREFWGKGIASFALAEFLTIVKERPLFARAASDNLASIRVLKKCGFVQSAIESGFAHGRDKVVEEFIFKRNVI